MVDNTMSAEVEIGVYFHSMHKTLQLENSASSLKGKIVTKSNEILRSKCDEISGRIIDTYVESLADLPRNKRVHFVRRAFRITGRNEFSNALNEVTVAHTIPSIKRRAELLKGIVHDGKPYPTVSAAPSRNVRVKERNKLLARRPELQFFRRYLMDLFQGQSVGLHETAMNEDWDSHIETLKKVDFDSLYIDLEVLHKMSSFAVNSVVFLKKLGVDRSLHRRFIGYLRGEYLEDDLSLAQELDEKKFTSLVYNLTHIIIADSDFYQNWVDGHYWIGEFFADWVDDILARCSHDVIAEVGLCIKLLKLEQVHALAYRKIVTHLLDTYDFEENLSPELFISREHTNAVIMLLFSAVDEWHKGPYFYADSSVSHAKT